MTGSFYSFSFNQTQNIEFLTLVDVLASCPGDTVVAVERRFSSLDLMKNASTAARLKLKSSKKYL